MSRWTQTPGQSKPMCEAMKRPAQELGLLSRSWGDRRTDSDPSPPSNGGLREGLHQEHHQGLLWTQLAILDTSPGV